MAFEELGLSKAEQLEIRKRAVAGHIAGLAIENAVPDIAADLEASLEDAAQQLSVHFGVTLEEARLKLAEKSAELFSAERHKEE